MRVNRTAYTCIQRMYTNYEIESDGGKGGRETENGQNVAEKML